MPGVKSQGGIRDAPLVGVVDLRTVLRSLLAPPSCRLQFVAARSRCARAGWFGRASLSKYTAADEPEKGQAKKCSCSRQVSRKHVSLGHCARERFEDAVQRSESGRGGIRTPGTVSRTPVFKTGALNHS